MILLSMTMDNKGLEIRESPKAARPLMKKQANSIHIASR